jgi:hypothetical protein
MYKVYNHTQHIRMMTEPSFYPQTLVDYAQIGSAVGTLAAVVVSLFLANRRPSPLLKISCSLRVIVWYQQQGKAPEYLTFNAVNEGETPATIVNVAWCLSLPFKKKRWAIQDVSTSDSVVRNPQLPHKLQHGESATFLIGLQGQYDWTQNIQKSGFFNEGIQSRKDCEHLRAVIFTSVGKPSICKPDKAVLDLIWEHQSMHLSSAKSQK